MVELLSHLFLFLFLVLGFYLISSPFHMRANIRALRRKKQKPLDKLLQPFVGIIAKAINLTNYKRLKLLNDLERAEMYQTPEEYYASAVVKALGVCTLSVFFYFLGMAIPAICLLIASVLVYMQGIKIVEDKLKQKDEEIMFSLPHFASVVNDAYKRNKDIPQILERYLKDVPDTPLAIDLNRTVARMHANGNIPEALSAFSKDIGNWQLSAFISALCEAYKGFDQTVNFAIVTEHMRALRMENIRRKTAKRPQKMRAVSFAIAVAIVLQFMIPLVLQLFSLNNLF